jgi:Holliday junction DNA helicase RuvA
LISRLKGILLSRDLDTVEVETSGGVVYEVYIPSSVMQRLPGVGEAVELRTCHVVREDATALYGFLEATERALFKRLLTASGVGAQLALAMLSTFSAGRLARALAEKDLGALTQVSGVGKKRAERIALDLSEKVQDLALVSEGEEKAMPPEVGEAVSALTALGFSFTAADELVRSVSREENDLSTEELIRKALGRT